MYLIFSAHNSDVMLVYVLMFLCHVMDFLVVIKVVKCDLPTKIWLNVVFPCAVELAVVLRKLWPGGCSVTVDLLEPCTDHAWLLHD